MNKRLKCILSAVLIVFAATYLTFIVDVYTLNTTLKRVFVFCYFVVTCGVVMWLKGKFLKYSGDGLLLGISVVLSVSLVLSNQNLFLPETAQEGFLSLSAVEDFEDVSYAGKEVWLTNLYIDGQEISIGSLEPDSSMEGWLYLPEYDDFAYYPDDANENYLKIPIYAKTVDIRFGKNPWSGAVDITAFDGNTERVVLSRDTDEGGMIYSLNLSKKYGLCEKTIYNLGVIVLLAWLIWTCVSVLERKVGLRRNVRLLCKRPIFKRVSIYVLTLIMLCGCLLMLSEKRSYTPEQFLSSMVKETDARIGVVGSSGCLAYGPYYSTANGIALIRIKYATDTSENCCHIYYGTDMCKVANLSPNRQARLAFCFSDLDDDSWSVNYQYSGNGYFEVKGVDFLVIRKDLIAAGIVLFFVATGLMVVYVFCSKRGKKLFALHESFEEKFTTEFVKDKILWMLPPALLLTFTFFVFGPLQLYLLGVSEFWFGIQDIVAPLLLCFVSVLALLVLCSVFMKSRILIRVVSVIFGLALALYIQGNYIGTNYGILDGTPINWNQYSGTAVWNTLLWCLLIGGAVFLPKFLKASVFRTVVRVLCYGIVTVQIITLSTLFLTTDLKKEVSATITNEKMLSMSADKNVSVFIVDGFDQSLFDMLLEKHPEYWDELSDFTYYSDAIGAFPYTWTAVPHIISGIRYDNDIPHFQYLEQSQKNNPLYQHLLGSNWDIGIYHPSLISTYLKEHIVNVSAYSPVVSSRTGLCGSMLRFTAFRYMPHIFKQEFFFYSGAFKQYMAGKDGVVPYSYDMGDIYDELLRQGVQGNNENKAFRIIYTEGVHRPFVYDSELNRTDTATRISQAEAAVKLILEYVQQLKQAGVYDNTAIVILSDHGVREYNAATPLLLVKQRNTSTRSMEVSTSPVSYDDLLATWLSLCDADYTAYGRSIFDIQEDEVRTRFFRDYSSAFLDKDGYFGEITEYSIVTKDDEIIMTPTGRVFSRPN